MKIKHTNINSICWILNHYFPLEIIINELIEITGDMDLDDFPEIQESITSPHLSLTSDAITELSEYFEGNNDNFISFIKKFVSETFLDNYLESYQSSEFLEKLNNILDFCAIRIKHHKIQKKVQIFNDCFFEDNLLFVNVDIPLHVVDYYKESITCLNNETFRSSILFSVFALEAGLKFTYKNLGNPGNKSLSYLITWATEEGVLENTEDEYDELNELRKYRNKLVHCDPAEHDDITSDIAEKRAVTDLNLINQSLNSIFY
ncbi:MAG: hypothetical protein ACC609_01325 [Methanobacterium formicicum]